MINISSVYIDQKIEKEVKKVLLSRFLVQGEKVKALEQALCSVNCSKYALVVNSGTAALHTALASIGIQAGDEVITSPFSFIATVNAILMCGAKPVFADIEENTFNIDPKLIESKISKKTKAILTVDLYGQPCNYEKIKKIAKKYKLKIISDSCQSIGAVYKNRPIAKWVDIACFSFYATKNIMMGEGGALVTSNKALYNFAKRFRQHGQDMEKPYIYHHLGYNYRATDLLAAIGLCQINFLDKWTRQRNKNARVLMDSLKETPGIIIPGLSKDSSHVFHQFTIRVGKGFSLSRDKLKEHLFKNGIGAGIYYPSILAVHPFIKKITKYKKGMYPVAEKITKEVLSLPVHPMLKKSDLEYIVSMIKSNR